MRVLFWYCNYIGWTPAVKTLDEAPDAKPGVRDNVVVAFVHVEPGDVDPGASAETKLIKNAKWLARKWETKEILLHSFTHLSEEKTQPTAAQMLLSSAEAACRDRFDVGVILAAVRGLVFLVVAFLRFVAAAFLDGPLDASKSSISCFDRALPSRVSLTSKSSRASIPRLEGALPPTH